jgi:type I restriction enzyme, S subunit
MNAENFINNFGHLVNAPEGPIRVRELILQLAFSGDLTTRSPEDVHASVVFDLCQQTRANWIAEGKIRQQPALNNLSVAEHPWELPKTWLWCRLGEVTTYGATDKAEFLDASPDTWVLELEDIEKDTSRLLAKVRAKERRFQSSKNRFSKGDVLYGKLRPYLDKVVLADEDGVCTTEIIPITIYCGILPQYLRWFLKSPFFKAYANGSTHGMNLPRMGTEAGRNAVFPLAPLAEQKRIAAKVNELMVLCDQLENQQQERERRFPVLSRTCHARFAEAPTPVNLNRIFDETGNVSPADLRRTVLSLAVQGMLVPQNPSDEPATRLVESIKETNNKPTNRKISKRRDLSIQEPFPLPPGWAWGRFPELGEFGRGKSKHRPRNDTRLYINGTYKLVQTGDVARAHGTILTHTGLYNEVGLAQSKLWPEGTLCITIAANIADSGILGFDACFPDSVVGFVPSKRLPSVRYFEYFMRTAKEAISKFAPATAQKNINLGILEQVQIPIPPANEQRRIVAKVDELMALVDQLEAQQQGRDELAEAFAKACVASFTGTASLENKEKMKAPKTELVSVVKIGRKPKASAAAPLAKLLNQHKGELPAKSLWQQSGLAIDVFYQQLKSEIAQGWITPPREAEMRVVEPTPHSGGTTAHRLLSD